MKFFRSRGYFRGNLVDVPEFFLSDYIIREKTNIRRNENFIRISERHWKAGGDFIFLPPLTIFNFGS